MRISRIGLGLCIALMMAGRVEAAPQRIAFQARVTDASGVPIADGAHAVVFTLYDASGAPLWTEAQSVADATPGPAFIGPVGALSGIPSYDQVIWSFHPTR